MRAIQAIYVQTRLEGDRVDFRCKSLIITPNSHQFIKLLRVPMALQEVSVLRSVFPGHVIRSKYITPKMTPYWTMGEDLDFVDDALIYGIAYSIPTDVKITIRDLIPAMRAIVRA